ncbi:MAG: hypothetical protein H7326_02220 [Bdellovibrionaceae bacterium]|nr:hypothetical protein [Pseudobdellovibrionaceae bacterium]
MFSKKIKTIMTASLVFQTLWLSSCSEFLNEKKQSPETIELSNERFACLKELPEQMNQYLEGQVSAADIRSGFDCGKAALVYFKSKTKGSLNDAYTLEDIRNFFGKYFLKRNNVTPEFAAQLFKIKKVILGGDEKSLTKAEIQKFADLLDVLKDHAVLLSPHFSVLMGKKAKPEWSDVNAGIEQLRSTSWVLLREVNLVNSDYTFDDLKKFIFGLNNFINSTRPFQLYASVEQNVELIEAVKRVLIGEDTRFEQLKDWEDGLKTVLQLYREGLRYKYFIKTNPRSNPNEMEMFTTFIDAAVRLVDESLPMKRAGVIPFTAIDNLLDRLAERKFLPENSTSAVLKETYKKIILRAFDSSRHGDSRGLEGFEKSHLVALRQEWRSYRLHQYFIDTLPMLDAKLEIAPVELAAASSLFKADEYVKNALSQNSLEQEALLKTWADGQALLRSNWPLQFNAAGRLLVVSNPKEVRQTWASLTRWNLMRALARGMNIGYGMNGLAEADLVRWYNDFQNFGIELKAFDPRNGNSGARSFKEANFFTFSGNGDGIMNPQETFEYVSALFAGGISSSNTLVNDMIARGCALPDKDVFGNPWLDEACFKRNLISQAGRYFDNLPGLVRQISTMKPAQVDEFYANLMASARTSPANGGRVETADLRTAVMMLHYTEILVTVYDRNRNGSLDEAEVKLAAPRFMQFMKSVSPIQANFVVSDFFLFLVFKGKKPTISEYLWFQGQKTFGSLGEVSRDKVLRVFKVLKEEAAKQ